MNTVNIYRNQINQFTLSIIWTHRINHQKMLQIYIYYRLVIKTFYAYSTVMLTLDAEPQPTISGGPLHGEYEYSQLHFHWGENDTMGSEDLIDGISFPLELHMVFYKKSYRNQRAALDHQDGLTVLAFFYEVSYDCYYFRILKMCKL